MVQLNPAARLYHTGITVVGFALLGALLWADHSALFDLNQPGSLTNFELLIFLTLFAFFASLSPVRTPSGLTYSVGLAPLYAAILILPAGGACLAGVIGTIDQRIPGRQIPWYQFFFNRGMFGIVYGAGALAFHALRDLQPGTVQGGVNFPLVSAALVALVLIATINSPLIIIAIALSTRQAARKIAYQSLQAAALSYAGLAPLGALIAYLAKVQQLAGFFMAGAIFILLVVYRELSRRSMELLSVARGSYVAQSRLIDKKDRSTYGHSERVGILSEATANKMHLGTDLVEQIRIGATLHDLGKIAIPDAILHKVGKLTDEEWEILKTHPQEGWDVLREQDVLKRAADIVRSHHENLDGSGYPDGLSGRAIPVGGRIIRVVDSYDCMTNVRDYRAWVRQPFDALAEIHSMAGTTYDPEVVSAFTEVLVEGSPDLSRELSGGEAPAKVTMLDALRFGPFLRLWAAQGLSNFGDMLTTTGLALAAYAFSHSTLAVVAIFAARSLPNLLFGLIAGPFVDRWDRKGLMLFMDLIRAALIGFVPFMINRNLALLLLITAVVSTAAVFFNPARTAAMPDLLPYNLLQSANSAMTFAERVTEILGFAAAGAIVALGTFSLLFAIDAMTFLISAGLILSISFPTVVGGLERPTIRKIREEIAAGLQEIRASPQLRVIFPFSFCVVAAGSALLPLMVPLAIDHLHAGSAGFPILEGSIAVGATLGAVMTGFLESSQRGILMILGALGMGVGTVFAGLSSTLPFAVIFFLAAGVANAVYLVSMITAIQELVDSGMRGRIFSVRFSMVEVGKLVGIGYAALITAQLFPGKAVPLAVVSAGSLLIVVSIGAALSPQLRKVRA